MARCQWAMLPLALLLLCPALHASIEAAPGGGAANLSGPPGQRQVQVHVGQYSVELTELTAWTLHQLRHRHATTPAGAPFEPWITPTGFMGSVMSLGSDASCCPGACCHWNGTGHGGEVVLNVTLVVDGVRHAVPPPPPPPPPQASLAATWTQCDRIFGGCPAVGLLEGGAGPAECERRCSALPNCTAFNVRMTPRGGCSLRDCPPGTAPTGVLADFAGYAKYPLPHCVPYVPAPPLPPPAPPVVYTGAVFSFVKYSRIGPLLSRQNVTIAASGVTQDYSYVVVDDTRNVEFLYSFMTMFANATSEWVAGTDVRLRQT